MVIVPGTRISHYRIERVLGRGGMGEVFLAQDLALGRQAAIKVLPPGIDPELGRRLLREAENSRRLQHPGIATFFESGDLGSTVYIAMEFVRGATLRERLRSGAIPAAEAVSIAAGLLEALVHAHRVGLVHRDIKPENVMLTPESSVKLLDFGLAHRASQPVDGSAVETGTVLTMAGTIVGSAGYMAPEQLRAGPVDARTDLFQVGAVLYEMLAGQPAFGSGPAVERIAATLLRDPPRLPESIGTLDRTVFRALARDPAQRPATAAEFLRDLRQLAEGRLRVAYPHSVAVLDLENRSANPDDAWIGRGIAESLGADLGRQPGLTVVPHVKVARALREEGGADPAPLGALLGCRWVLSGSYQKVGSSLRVLVNLTHVPTERITWSEKTDGAVEGLFQIQDRLAAKVLETLDLTGTAGAEAARPAPDLGAYECYTRGMQQFARMSKGGFDQAEDLLEEAIRLKGDYADALAGLAGVHAMRFTYTTDPAELAQAAAHASRAVETDPRHGVAHVWLGYALWRQGRWDQAHELFRRAAQLDASNHYPPYFSGCLHLARGDAGGALGDFQTSVRLAPGSGFSWFSLGVAHMELARHEEALWSLEKAVELERAGWHSTAGAAGVAGECLRRQGRLAEARAKCLEGVEAAERSDHMYRDSFRAICLNALGRTALDQGDRDAARAAFRQSALHLEGRPRTLAGGQLYCQALAGQAHADSDSTLLARARELFERRGEYDWSWFFHCADGVTSADIVRAAKASQGPPP